MVDSRAYVVLNLELRSYIGLQQIKSGMERKFFLIDTMYNTKLFPISITSENKNDLQRRSEHSTKSLIIRMS